MTITACVDYEDPTGYVQPKIIKALQKYEPDVEITDEPTSHLQWSAYETIDWDHIQSNPTTSLACSYVIRKALIRKHYLSNTVSSWLVKHPESVLGRHVPETYHLELDYVEYLDEALEEMYELRQSLEGNEEREQEGREWWILKPGMSDRGQGIRLFSTYDALESIFQEFEPESDDEDDGSSSFPTTGEDKSDTGVITSQLRHFVVQRYLPNPLLLSLPATGQNHKFHLRVYVVAAHALRVYVYRDILVLSASEPYTPPKAAAGEDGDGLGLEAHLTNTCLQSGERQAGSVHRFWSPSTLLPHKDAIYDQIAAVVGEVFKAAVGSQRIHFQTLPNAFEVFGLDFLVAEGDEGTGVPRVELLEVNSYPDFKQTGKELGEVVEGLFEGVAEKVIRPFFCKEVDVSGEGEEGTESKEERMRLVYEEDLMGGW
ncbi:TTL-domain-containing protein [Saitoella complicata NRRL Y-17804]|uniref:Tubulin-tyrosine ligase n=1 Tax=Saitoella complicata (strain BCRC 22490 / CBS 7301 / JCM 7358 / NBRC 10748 / NRRL Y-17804) TaxID=698492 RepID=A0A0E9NCW2_SAICN|nr:TTL-domain-containing protein [Saitoella complicata NRRL Y-17804]ODQ49939.1 TTL-domain-containing protein [Saitoella complicata NRRL Y-17804]GAO47638.1 hypothetical protein G7K_1838-t1 [Saitoella complicata NRRL Y-17804]